MKKISLSGIWSFSPKKNFDDASECFEVQVPGSWKSVPELADCDVGAYHYTFALQSEDIKKYAVLNFRGVFRCATVRLNGVVVGKHNGF